MVKRTIRVFKSSEQNINHSATAKTLPVLLLAETLTPNNLLQQRSRFNETTWLEGLQWQDAWQTELRGAQAPVQGCTQAPTFLQGADPLPCSPARRQSQSSHARGRATNPPTPALRPPLLLWSKHRGCSSCAPELGWRWKCQCELKQERNGGRFAARTVVLGEASLSPYKNHSEASRDADLAPLNSSLMVSKTYSQRNRPFTVARVKGLEPRKPSTSHWKIFNTSAFVPKCVVLSFNTGDQHVLHLQLRVLLDLQTARSPGAFSTALHPACGSPWAPQFSVTRILTVE